jgi:hypothetical protein
MKPRRSGHRRSRLRDMHLCSAARGPGPMKCRRNRLETWGAPDEEAVA